MESSTMKELRTARLFLTPYHSNDLLNLLNLRKSEKVWHFSTNIADNSIEQATLHLDEILAKYENHDYAPFALLNSDEIYVGEAGVYHGNIECKKINIGYNLLPEFWGNGYATEITKALIHWYFSNTDMQRIEGTVTEDNAASRRVLEKSNMVLEGVLRKYTMLKGEYKNVCIYSIIR